MWNSRICGHDYDHYCFCLLQLWEEVAKPIASPLQISAQAKDMFSSALAFFVFSHLYHRNKTQWRACFERITVKILKENHS